MTTALLVIDVQRELCEGRWACHDIDAVLGRINGLLRRARAAGRPVVLVQHEEAEGPMARGAEGWQLATGLEVEPGDLLVAKRACDAFHQTELLSLLRGREVAELVVCGLQTDFCVDTTVRRALALGFPQVLVADGHSTVDNGALTAPQIVAHHNATLSNIGSFGPRVRLADAADVRFDA